MKRKFLALFGAAVLAVASLFVWATQTGANSSQATLLDAFCDQCGLPSNAALRNLVASTVTLSDTQTITGVKSFSGGLGVSGSAAAGPAPIVLSKGGLPLVALSSGSVSASGAITGITALPLAYPKAFCFFPASTLATSGTGSTAGWYYCTFSDTSHGTACLNTYSTGPPTAPASCTAVTAGQGSFTGDTSAETALQITVPANSMGAHGVVRFGALVQSNSTGNTKTFALKFSGTGGTAYINNGTSGILSARYDAAISNNGATGAQVGNVAQTSTGSATAYGASLGTADTTADTTLVVQLTRTTATDNIVLLPPLVELLSNGS